jgi:hypothetical protein
MMIKSEETGNLIFIDHVKSWDGKRGVGFAYSSWEIEMAKFDVYSLYRDRAENKLSDSYKEER